MEKQLTTRQVAQALGVSDASLKRWCDRGLIPCVRTAGGHRRLPISSVIQYLLSSGHPLLRPDLLGLPPSNGDSAMAVERCRNQMLRALQKGDEDAFRRVGFNLFLAGLPAREIFDRALIPVLGELEETERQGRLKIFQWRRSLMIIQGWVYELRSHLMQPAADAPRATGGALEASPAAGMIDLALREAGWRTDFLGEKLPLAALVEALRELRPSLLWIQVSPAVPVELLAREYGRLISAAQDEGVLVAVVGPGLPAAVRQEMRQTAFCDSINHLVGLARTLAPSKRSLQAVAG